MTASELPTLRVSFVRRLAYWLEPRWRDPGWLAFALNRLTGHILILYLILHMVVLSQLLDGRMVGIGCWACSDRARSSSAIRCSSPRSSSTGSTDSASLHSRSVSERATPRCSSCSCLAPARSTALAGWAILT